MLKKLFALAILGLVVHASYAAPESRIRDFMPVGIGEVDNPDGDGNAIINYKPDIGQSDILVSINGFMPATTYGVLVTGSGSEASNRFAITTNHRGNGHIRMSIAGDASPNARVVIYIWDGNPDPDSFFDVTADEIRAEGSADSSITRIRHILPAGVGTTENPDSDGRAILRMSTDEFGGRSTEIFVRVIDMLPHVVYGVRVENTQGAELSAPDAITTNGLGNGGYRITLPDDYTGIVTVTIYRWDGDVDTILEVSPDELRAQGT